MAITDFPWFKIYAAETLSDENFISWTVAQRGIWLTLLCHCWKEGSIPADLPTIARLCGVDAQAMPEHWPGIAHRFQPHCSDPTRLVSPRLEFERQASVELAKSKRDHARKGASARWGKYKTDMPEHSPSNAQPMPKDAPKPEPKNITTPTPSGGMKRAKRGSAAAEILNDPERLEIFRQAWIIHPRRRDSAGDLRPAGNQAEGATQLLARIQEGLRWDEVVQVEREYHNHPYVKNGYAEDFQKFWGANGQWFGILQIVRDQRRTA